MTQALYRKWRPQTFDQVVGQEHVTKTLRNALVSGRVGHAYLFSGLRGTGKTTMARLVAKAVNCLAEEPAERPCNTCAVCQAVSEGRFLDLIEIDAASHTGVDDVRELRDRVGFRPNEGRYKVYIIDEVHRFSGSAFDALLKTIEEPPDHAIFILATTEIHKVPATILSRCQRFDFRRIPLRLIVQRLGRLAEAEGITAEPEALALIARSATGSLRDAESLLDQLSAANLEGITVAQVQATLGTIDTALVNALVDGLVARDVTRGLTVIDQALDQGADLRQFARQIVDHLRGMLLIQLEGQELLDITPESLQVSASQAEQISASALLAAIKRFSRAENELKGGWQPQLPLELALVEMIVKSDGEAGAAMLAEPTPAPVGTKTGKSVPDGTSSRTTVATAPAPPSQDVPEEDDPDELTLPLVQQHWGEVLESARGQDRSVQALLNSTRPHRVQGQTVTLQVAHEFARSKLSEGRARRLVEEVMTQVFDQPCRVEYELSAFDEIPTGAEWDDDPVVQAARQMGAKVRPIDEGRK